MIIRIFSLLLASVHAETPDIKNDFSLDLCLSLENDLPKSISEDKNLRVTTCIFLYYWFECISLKSIENNENCKIAYDVYKEYSDPEQWTDKNGWVIELASEIFNQRRGDPNQFEPRGPPPNNQDQPKSDSSDKAYLSAVSVAILICFGIGFLLLVFMIIIVCVYLKVKKRRRLRMLRIRDIEYNHSEENQLNIRVVTKDMIEKIMPVEVYNANSKIIGQSVCTICLMELVWSNLVRITPCLHPYHQDCIDEWLISKRKPKCPNCNKNPFDH